MRSFDTFRLKLNEVNLDSLNKVEIASLFFEAGYDQAAITAIEVLESYANLETTKKHLREALEKE